MLSRCRNSLSCPLHSELLLGGPDAHRNVGADDALGQAAGRRDVLDAEVAGRQVAVVEQSLGVTVLEVVVLHEEALACQVAAVAVQRVGDHSLAPVVHREGVQVVGAHDVDVEAAVGVDLERVLGGGAVERDPFQDAHGAYVEPAAAPGAVLAHGSQVGGLHVDADEDRDAAGDVLDLLSETLGAGTGPLVAVPVLEHEVRAGADEHDGVRVGDGLGGHGSVGQYGATAEAGGTGTEVAKAEHRRLLLGRDQCGRFCRLVVGKEFASRRKLVPNYEPACQLCIGLNYEMTES